MEMSHVTEKGTNVRTPPGPREHLRPLRVKTWL